MNNKLTWLMIVGIVGSMLALSMQAQAQPEDRQVVAQVPDEVFAGESFRVYANVWDMASNTSASWDIFYIQLVDSTSQGLEVLQRCTYLHGGGCFLDQASGFCGVSSICVELLAPDVPGNYTLMVFTENTPFATTFRQVASYQITVLDEHEVNIFSHDPISIEGFQESQLLHIIGWFVVFLWAARTRYLATLLVAFIGMVNAVLPDLAPMTFVDHLVFLLIALPLDVVIAYKRDA